MQRKKRANAWWKSPLIFLAGLFACAALGFLSYHPHHLEAVSCSSGAAAQNGISVAPSHGNVFYIDTGVTPVLDAGYIGYRVTNSTGSTKSDLWAEVSNFSGGKVTLANPLDSQMQLQSLTNGSTGTAYFMLKATGATTSAQAHTLKVYNHRPDLSDASLLYQCDFSFSKVQETIKAAANKLANNGLNTSAAIEVSDTSPELGQLITITTEGQTGQIGQGSSPDFDIIWLTPAAISTWPTRALRLENVSITFDGNGNWSNTGDEVTYNNQLLIQNADGLTNVDNSEYRASYQFRVIGRPNSTVKAVPVAQISSGTQVKHSDTGATGATLDINFSSLAINAALTKSVTSTTGLTVVNCTGACAVTGESNSGLTYVEVPYRLTAASSTSTTLTVDEFVDQPPAGLIFKPGSATVTDIGRTNVAISDPVNISTDSSPKPNHFVGPFTLNSGTTASVNYTMWVPVGSYANTAYAKIGDQFIGATSSAMSRVTVTSTGTSTVGVVVDTVSFSVAADTEPATNITSSAATLNGTVDPNGASILTGQFQYGTSSSLSGATTVTATTPTSGNLNTLTDPTAVSVNLTGLSPATTYYFRVIAGSAQGSILSFTTAAVAGAPTVTTTAATSIASSSATLNGTINPNLTAITGIQFIYGTSSSLASGNTTTTVDDGSGTAALTAGGSSEQPFSKGITGLTGGTTYYFKIRACTSALTGSYPNVTCSSFVDGSILSFTAGLTARTLTIDSSSYTGSYHMTDAAPTITSTASAGVGTKSYSSSTTGVCTVDSSTGLVTFVSAGTCTISADIASDGTYSSASASSISFTVSLTPRTLTIDSSSYIGSYALADSPPTITSTASVGAGTKNYSSSTPLICSIDGSTGLVTFIADGTCTISATIASDGTYASASALEISFDISATPLTSRTHQIDGFSYVLNYVLTDAAPTITSTPSAGTGTKSYSSSTLAVCTIDSGSGVVTFVSAGTCTIGSSISSDGTYSTASASPVSFTLSLASRSLSIDGSSYTGSYALSDSPPTITSTATAGVGTKSYISSTLSVCTIDGVTGVVTFVAPGTCTLSADITSDGTYESAISPDISFDVTAVPLLSRTLSIDGLSYESSYFLTDIAPTITSTASHGVGTKSYSSSTPSVCTIDSSSGLVTFVTTGTCTISADIASDGTYDSATASSISFSINPQSGGHHSEAAPTGVSVIIQSGAACVTGDEVTITLSATGATQVLVSNDASFSGAVWQPFSGPTVSIPWTLAGEGSQTVYALFKNSSLQSGVVSDSIDMGSAVFCGESPSEPSAPEAPVSPSEPGAPSSPDAVPPVPAGTPENVSPEPAPGAQSVADNNISHSYNVSIVNPDGTVRDMADGTYSRIDHVTPNVDIIRFEDKGVDFDFNDVIIKVDHTNWNQVIISVLSVDAGWRHNIRLSLSGGSQPLTDALLWADSHLGVGRSVTVNADDTEGLPDGANTYVNPDGTLPTLPESTDVSLSSESAAPLCDVLCKDIRYDIFLINPDHTERHRNSVYVKEAPQKDGSVILGFEDSGQDFDYNDVQVKLESTDCSAVKLTLLSVNARWHHQIALSAIYGGEQKFTTVIWPDTQAAVGDTRSIDVRDNALMCIKTGIPVQKVIGTSCVLPFALTKTLRQGSAGPDVLSLQNLLGCMQLFPATPSSTGYYGGVTTKAVTSYQRLTHLTPLGIVNSVTRALLNQFFPTQ